MRLHCHKETEYRFKVLLCSGKSFGDEMLVRVHAYAMINSDLRLPGGTRFFYSYIRA